MKTVSLSLAKELNANGYPEKSYMCWNRSLKDDGEEIYYLYPNENILNEWSIAAPTADEIGILFPSNLDEFVRENLDDVNTELYFEWCNTDHPYYNPDLLAKMWLYLKKENLL